MILINLQSIVDVITNSSTEIYVSCTNDTINHIKNLLSHLINDDDVNVNDIFIVDTIDLIHFSYCIEYYIDDNDIKNIKMPDVYNFNTIFDFKEFINYLELNSIDIDIINKFINDAIKYAKTIDGESSSVLILFKTPEYEEKYKHLIPAINELFKLVSSFKIDEKVC